MVKARMLVAAAALMAVSFTVGGGVAYADGVDGYNDPPTTPAKVTVKNPAKPYPLMQPPIEWTAFAQPYGRVPQGKSASNFSILGLGILENMPTRVGEFQPMRYSLFYETAKDCNAQLDIDGHYYGMAVKILVPKHWIWMSKNDWVEITSNKCYQIYNGKWIYEYVNFFEMPIVKDPQKLPGRYPKDVPPEQQKYLRK